MSKFLEGLASMLLPTLKTLETAAVVELLEKMYQHDPAEHKAALLSLYPGLLRLRVFAEKTTTKFDNVGVDGIIAAVEQSATLHGITLIS